MCPCQIKDAIREISILVFLHKAQAHVAGFADTRDNIYRCRFCRIQRYPIPDGDNRIEHGALAARERPREKIIYPAHSLWIGDGVSAADELHAIGLIGDFSDLRPMHSPQAKHPWRLLVPGTGPARPENRRL